MFVSDMGLDALLYRKLEARPAIIVGSLVGQLPILGRVAAYKPLVVANDTITGHPSFCLVPSVAHVVAGGCWITAESVA